MAKACVAYNDYSASQLQLVRLVAAGGELGSSSSITNGFKGLERLVGFGAVVISDRAERSKRFGAVDGEQWIE